MADSDSPSPQTIEQLKEELQAEMTKRFAGWAIAGGLGVLGLAALGAWTILKPQIVADLGIVSEATIEDMIAAGTDGLATQEAVATLSEAVPSDDHIRELAGGTASIPVGAVVAFDGARYHRKSAGQEHISGCPEGWVRFLEAQGRFILGASPPGVEGEYELRGKGGAKVHVLTAEQVPNHWHNVPYTPIEGAADRAYPVIEGVRKGIGRRENLQTAGSGGTNDGTSPHNNMPPYIGLYFCKKES